MTADLDRIDRPEGGQGGYGPILHLTEPTTEQGLIERGIELALSILCDNDDPRVLDHARAVTGWDEKRWNERCIELLALAADPSTDEYAHALRELAAGPDDLMKIADAVQERPLRAVKS